MDAVSPIIFGMKDPIQNVYVRDTSPFVSFIVFKVKARVQNCSICFFL